LTVGTSQDLTADAARPAPEPEGQSAAVWRPTRIGELVGGKYRISRFLAEGGMGVVYEAQHAIVKRRFAVKFLRPDFAQRRENLGRFQLEAEAAGGLESEHIASVVDFGIATDGSAYIVMECLVGESLASLLRREGRLPYQRAADLCVQACHGAETAHASGIVHRDLKPQNVFICRREDGTDLLKILDFGIAKLEPIKHEFVSTETGAVLGTPAYMSPEQARGERTIDRRTDVYSLGAILFEMLSGRLPHPGDSSNAVLHHISTQPAVPLASVASDLPKSLAGLVDRALSSDPDARPQSAKAFAVEVAAFAKHAAWPQTASLDTTSPPAAGLVSSERTPAVEPPRPSTESGPAEAKETDQRRRHPPWARIAVLGAVTALVAVAGPISIRWFKTAPESRGEPAGSAARVPSPSTGTPPSKHEVSANAETAPRAEATGLVPALPSGSDPAASPRLDGPVSMPGKALVPKHEQGGGRPVGRSPRRPTATSAENAGEGARPGSPTQDSTRAKSPFPRALFDPANPYGSP
jgi:serine/threonine protein kinase